MYLQGSADISVIGAGHAGIEAALAAARLGMRVLLFTINLDAVGNMPCNPSIGGTGKGHLVYEIDALGGEMGRAADLVTLQSRTLNLGKGPAVHSKRVQADRMRYRNLMKKTLENTPNLSLIQAEIADILFEGEGEERHVTAVVTSLGGVWEVKAAIICAGTYLRGQVIIGDYTCDAGPDGMLPATKLTSALEREGIRMMRFKTGTPARVHADSIALDRLEVQEGEEPVIPFSLSTPADFYEGRGQIPCHIVYTNANTHDIIRSNLDRSPLFSGKIKSKGPRYCPSIEDKVVRFADKERHQLFIEPTGEDTKEMYIQGFSSSMPEDVQMKMLRSLEGFENARVMRTAYAIEYDCSDPTQLFPTLEYKEHPGLYGAGQFNGTSGYEEAAAQGIVAGINAALKIKGEEPLILTRASSYIGMLIVDLVTKGTNEPYRVMTSRSEYRLLLRQDNADERLCPLGRRVGLLGEDRWQHYLAKKAAVEAEVARVKKVVIPPSEALSAMLEEKGTPPVTSGVHLDELLRRPQVSYADTAPFDSMRPQLTREAAASVEIEIKYEGYIRRQLAEVEKFRKLEEKLIPEGIDYSTIEGLRIEAKQKLAEVRPKSIGQASRISGVSPADISVLLIRLGDSGRY